MDEGAEDEGWGVIYGSVCSGIEAATVAWHPLGWRPAFFSEIDPFPRAVLAHHYPDVPLHGDFTTIREADYAAIDVLVGGTPCQSFSVAGLRKGLDDERGNLALEFCLLARRLGPKWVIWENVPGVLSLDGGRAFASILGGLAECGYGLAYRVLDSQFVRVDGFGRAVPQRRRRVFVVGYLGDWRRAAAVLFERASMSGNIAPRREAGKRVARPIASGPDGGSGYRNDTDTAENLIAFQGRGTNLEVGRDVFGTLGTTIDRASGSAPCIAHTLNAKGGVGRLDYESETLVAHSLRGGGFDASEDGTGRGTPIVQVATLPLLEIGKGSTSRGDGPNGAGFGDLGDPMFTLQAGAQHGVAIAFDETQITLKTNRCQPQAGEMDHPLAAGARPPTIAFHARQDPDHGDVTHPLDTDGSSVGIFSSWRVRRLTPVEAERLQGFSDGYTLVPYRKKLAADGPRYRALGNSMAVNCMRWLGRRIEAVEAIRG